MLVLILILSVVSILIEIKLVSSVPLLESLLGKSKICSFAFSLLLSWLLGIMFHAAGLIILVAALVSSVAVQPYYRFHRVVVYCRDLASHVHSFSTKRGLAYA